MLQYSIIHSKLVGHNRLELNTYMKLTITPQRLAANRQNARKGTEVWVEKRQALYQANPSYCRQCNTVLPQEKKNNKFCSRSCSAQHSNARVLGTLKKPRPLCAYCGNPTKTVRAKFCSIDCTAGHQRKYTPEQAAEIRRIRNREVAGNYRARLVAQTPADVDREAIREFYAACPPGYEVDHIIPISKGGAHSLENLQYLTVSENRRKSNKLI